ncbi:hypothetical protein BAE44_0018577, partial [Dichanthelium oligosanthes]
LGGHRTSHIRRSAAMKHRSKKHVVVVHACGTYRLGFSIEQALGGHTEAPPGARRQAHCCMGFLCELCLEGLSFRLRDVFKI